MADPEDASVQRLPAAGLPPARTPGSMPAVPGALPEHDSRPGHVDQLARSIIRSKVQPPPVRSSTLERPRLLQWLNRHASERLILVSGEAGYGKTTLLSDFARRSAVRCLWYRLDATDRDWVTFITYVIAAVREARPDFGTETAAMLAQMAAPNLTLEGVLTSLLGELPGIGSVQTVLILDDFQSVDDSADVHTILARLFQQAPTNLSFLLAGRVAPAVRIGRMEAHGEVGRLSTEDLRFSPEETADLFAIGYQLPLEPDLVEEIDARAEGWAASLQLVYSSIRARRPSEARAFIQSLSGTEGALYDYLAEEVLAGLAEPLQRLLVRASLLERVVPVYVAAILSSGRGAPAIADVSSLLDEADRLGLMGRRAVGASTWRFHPLLREYLRRQLDTGTNAIERRDMHSRVARAAEQANDWLAACHHFIEGEEPAEAMRVLNNSAAAALGSGALGASMALVGRIGATDTPAAVKVIQARHLISIGEVDRAAKLLEELGEEPSGPDERAVLALARVLAAFKSGRVEVMEEHIQAVVQDPELPKSLSDIGRAWEFLVTTGEGGRLQPAATFLIELGGKQSNEGQTYFAGISFHNALVFAIAQADYLGAITFGDRALSLFATVPEGAVEALSTRAHLATAAWELGYQDRAKEETRILLASTGGEADAYAECAWSAALRGDEALAAAFAQKARAALANASTDIALSAFVDRVDSVVAIASGHATDIDGIDDSAARLAVEPDFIVRNCMVRAMWEGTKQPHRAAAVARRGLQLAIRQGARRYEPRLSVAVAAAEGDGESLAAATTRAAASGHLALLETADLIAASLHHLPNLPDALEESIRRWPTRWLGVLRRQMGMGNAPAAHAAARVIAQFGQLSDATRLVAFERSYLRAGRHRSLSKELIRRASPILHIHDLGRASLEIGAYEVDLARTRRKAASLLMFLVSRPGQTATREQVIEELWPDLEPSAAVNSLNQTLYFVRRDIDPWYDDAISADYVVNESELVWLDPQLAIVDSVSFYSQASESMTSKDIVTAGPRLIAQYQGRFSPEFEYEEWALGWRERLHATFLLLVHSTEQALVERGDYSRAVDVLMSALAIDPDALNLETDLVRALRRVGADAAAAEQYAHLSRSYRGELGVEPPSFESLAPNVD